MAKKGKFKIIIIFCFLLIFSSNAQYPTRLPSQTNIIANDYKIIKAENLYELALNMSYFVHFNYQKKQKILVLPVIIINNKPADYTTIKNIKIDEIKNYSFEFGDQNALYGTMGEAGILKVELKEN